MKNFNVGDIVDIGDASYVYSIVDNNLKHEDGISSLKDDVYKIVALNCNLPTYNRFDFPDRHNDVILSGINSGKIIFIRKEQITKIKDERVFNIIQSLKTYIDTYSNKSGYKLYK
jgi:hypothetical protein